MRAARTHRQRLPPPVLHSPRVLTALIVYAVLLGVVLLEPTGRLPSAVVQGAEAVLDALGAAEVLLASGRVEFLLNVVMFAPLTALASWRWPQWSVSAWVTLTFYVSAGVELAQALVVIQRSATFSDIVANTAGGLLGALVVRVLLGRRRYAGTRFTRVR